LHRCAILESMKDYRRKPQPELKKRPILSGWKLTQRDRRILQTIPQFEGFLSVDQVRWLFFPRTNGGKRAAYRRCRAMTTAHYLRVADKHERKLIPAQIYWLDEAGYQLYTADNPSSKLRWRKKPRFDRVAHDLSVNDFHLDLLEAATEHDFELVEWYPGYIFETYPDTITFLNTRQKETHRRIEPDSFFMLKHNQKYRRFGLEVELSPKKTMRLMDDKVLPLLAWVKSAEYKQRFGYKSGGFLFTFSDETVGLMQLLIDRIRQTLKEEGRYFHFARMSDINPETILTAPIWHKSTTREPLSLQAACNR
jgi:hypothetical protein